MAEANPPHFETVIAQTEAVPQHQLHNDQKLEQPYREPHWRMDAV